MTTIKIPRQRLTWILAGGFSALLLLAAAAAGVFGLLRLFRPPTGAAVKNITGNYESFVREIAACDKTVTVEITYTESRPEELYIRLNFPENGGVYYKYKKSAPELRDVVASQCGNLAKGFVNVRRQNPITRILVGFHDAATHTESFCRFELSNDGKTWSCI